MSKLKVFLYRKTKQKKKTAVFERNKHKHNLSGTLIKYFLAK